MINTSPVRALIARCTTNSKLQKCTKLYKEILMKALVIEVHNVAVVNVWRLSWADVRFPV